MENYYNILGISRNASEGDIKSAYRRLARQLHPDVNKGDKESQEKFKKVNAAYDVLGDPERRKKYDQFGEDWKHADNLGDFGGGGGVGRSGVNFDIGDILGRQNFSVGDLFGSFGGNNSYGSSARKVEADVDISLQEAFYGTSRRLSVDLPSGMSNIEVSIPSGIKDGDRMTFRPKGVEVVLRINVLPDKSFTRRGDDLSIELEIPLLTALLGGETKVCTMDGEVVLRIPADTQNGASFRLRGKGMSRRSGDGRGDLFAIIKVQLPVPLSKEDRSLFRRMRTPENDNRARKKAKE